MSARPRRYTIVTDSAPDRQAERAASIAVLPPRRRRRALQVRVLAEVDLL